MSEAADSEDRTEQPSEKRLREARERGDVPRSKELANVAVLGSTVVAVLALGPGLAYSAMSWLRDALQIDPAMLGHHDRLLSHAATLMGSLSLAVLPIVLVALAGCFIAPAALGGLRFSGQALQPKFNKLNPMAGLARIYGKEGFAELARSILRVLIIGAVGVAVMSRAMHSMPALQQMSLENAAASGLGFMVLALAATVGSMGLLAALDAPYQRWAWTQKMKMTKQELRDESKENEGNPEVKGKLRQVAREMAQRQMMEAVPTADVIVTNPTHYAVALKYEPGRMRAPKVVAKGVDEIALRIREIGGAHRVSVIESPPLARALYRHSQVDQEIPVQLYAAVAQILSYVFQLRSWHPSRGPMPTLSNVGIDPALDDGQAPR